ncbi:transposase [Corynebacterium bovis]|uniref:transposase n=1 Tax=Corynebacterium bovis TaxID=36808 RepID=UPI000F64CA92|nr:hypothetical protein CXF46_11075 [Corynebacterium bovis]
MVTDNAGASEQPGQFLGLLPGGVRPECLSPLHNIHSSNGKKLWTPGYYAGTTGGAGIDTVRRYIEQQDTPA